MTTPRGSKKLATAIVAFETACGTLIPPPIIASIVHAADRAKKQKSPVSSFNRYVGAARKKASAYDWVEAREWFVSADVVSHFSRRGAFWMLPIWEDAINCLQGGLEVNSHFG